MKIYLGTDHAGFKLKEKIKKYLTDLNYLVEDMGALKLDETDDYPDFIRPVAEVVAKEDEAFGIIFGGSGQGEAICANKVNGIRAAVFYGGGMDIVRLMREHNNANILSLGARFLNEDEAREAVKLFLEIKFTFDERHVRRINKLEK